MTITNTQNRLGNLSVNLVHLMFRALNHRGVDPTPLTHQFRLTSALLESPYGRISIPRFMRLGHQAQALVGKERLGLLMGECMQINDWGLPGTAAMCAPTVGEALSTIIRFESLYSENSRGTSSTAGQPDKDKFCSAHFYSIKPYNAYNFFVVDSVLACWHRAAQWLAGRRITPDVVRIEYKPPENEEIEYFEAFFGCPVHFGQSENALIYQNTTWLTPNQYQQKNTGQAIEEVCRQQLNELKQKTSQKKRVIEAITPLLHAHPPTLEEVAAHLGTTPWTLQRKLAREGCKFSDLLNTTRKELAESYVKDTDFSFTEIAYLLGFSTPASFQRAFRRWHGMTPGAFRQRKASPDYNSIGSSS